MSTKRLVQPWWGGKQGLIVGAAPFCGAGIATQFPGKYDAVNTQIQIQYIKHPNTVPALGAERFQVDLQAFPIWEGGVSANLSANDRAHQLFTNLTCF